MSTLGFLEQELPPLPKIAVTKDGAKFDPQSDRWPIKALAGGRVFDFARFAKFNNNIRHRLKLCFVWLLEQRSFSHSQNLYQQLTVFYFAELCSDDLFCEMVTLSNVVHYRSALNDKTEWKLGALRVLLTEMDRLGFGITSFEGLNYLRNATLKGNVKGTSVRTRDPEKGAFSDCELLAIQSSLNDSYAEGKLSLYEFGIAWILMAYGVRAIQIAALKERDLIVSDTGEGRFYALRVPRAKQQGEAIRGSFKTRYCGQQIGQLLEKIIRHNHESYKLHGLGSEDWPLFVSASEGELPALKYHMSSEAVGLVVRTAISRVTDIKMSAKRFRITLAQRAVDDGKDKYTVAELLDHSDTQNVGVYFEAGPAMVLRIDHHMAMEMAPLAQAFAGVVVETEANALRGDQKASRIYDRTIANNVDDALGTCGQMSFCGLAVPFACYTCRHFQPWLEAPHEKFMDALIEDRERMITEGYSSKIYAIRDRTIQAVAEVIQLCTTHRELADEATA
ncbi:site-specific integrase [Rhizobium leguminosarum]|uniref:site-specific integrase n=1 Tax=Rhizobium leguminosarum TaxID=384 RepID=UPI00103771C9|nr:site-specific integrase [Rhizobium leguminosarum]TBG89591.1 site-specific integrase [Rhizobium leguminosarum]